MGIGIQIEFHGLKDLQKQLEAYRKAGGNLRPALQKVGKVIIHSTDQNFEAEGRPKGWKPRSLKTLRSMEAMAAKRIRQTKGYQNLKRASTRAKHESAAGAKFKANKLLSMSGDLKKSITDKVGKDHVIVGSSLPYATVHQFGHTFKPRTIRAKRAKALQIPTAGGYIFRRSVNLPAIRVPARPFLVVQKEDEEKIMRIFTDYISKGQS